MSILKERFDVAVIGAGPAGSMAAKYAAKSGARTLLLEEHPAVGWPVECAGLLGLGALAESELPGSSFVLRRMKGAAIYSPGGNRLDFKALDSRASVVDRRLFDRAARLRGPAGGGGDEALLAGQKNKTGGGREHSLYWGRR